MKLTKMQRGYETLESRVSVACSVTRAEFLFAFCIAGGVGEARVGTRWRKIRAASECHLKMHASFSLRMSSRPCTPILHCDGIHRFHTRRLKSLPFETQTFQPFWNEFFASNLPWEYTTEYILHKTWHSLYYLKFYISTFIFYSLTLTTYTSFEIWLFNNT